LKAAIEGGRRLSTVRLLARLLSMSALSKSKCCAFMGTNPRNGK